MTQKELLALPHLAIAEVNEKWVHIHTEEGYYVTDYKESDDIITYNGFLCMYAPIREEYTEYRVITENEHLEYEKNKQEKINEEYDVQ